ncbi:MAG: hypothetical protein FGM47_03215 [Candidatus Nanopelagicaceae bacterium]|nr:hypothetical protein [Candidatus Nanopelagicaceae bacterium]
MSQSSAPVYIPGSCNLGREEIRRRQLVAILGLVLSISTFAGLVGSDAPSSARWGMFVPLMVFSIGFIQSRRKFCLAYGFMGTFNLGKLGDLSRVQSPEDRKADRKTALGILLQAAGLSLILTVATVLLPF